MIFIRAFLLCLLLTGAVASAETLAPPTGVAKPTHPATSATPGKITTAPRIPVVQAPHAPNARKVQAKAAQKTAVKPPAEAKPEDEKAAAAAVAAPAPAEPPAPVIDPTKGSVTGLAIPRFMSLRFDDVNLRVGPGTRYPIDWVYHRRDLPVEILRELEDWRLVQDQDNIRGWVRAPTLSPRRAFSVRESDHVLRASAADDAAAVARLKPGVVGRVRLCAAASLWCEVEVATYRGWLKRQDIFGVYPGEQIGG